MLGRPWPAERVVDLWVDLVHLTVGHLGRGTDRASVIARFGPPANYFGKGKSGRVTMNYPQLGLSVYLGASGQLELITVYPGTDDPLPGFAPYRGGWRHDVDIAAPDEATLVRILGEPTEREVDEWAGIRWTSLNWTRPDVMIDADFHASGRIPSSGIDFDP